MSSLIAVRHAAIRQLFDLADAIIVLTDWVRDVLIRNGVAASKLIRSRHGIVDADFPIPESGPRETNRSRIRIAHLGRLDPVKGTGLLIDALRSERTSPIDLDVYGVAQNAAGNAMKAALMSRAAGDARIQFRDALPPGEVVRQLGRYDAVAVPSQWMETGPLVVLEAFAAGVPVVGSALGGIADLVRDSVDGLLVSPYDSVEAWRAALVACAADGRLASLRRGVRRPRSMADVASEMRDVYRQLVDLSSGRDRRSRQAAVAF
jgi:glycosyltransferase involved in cell wall biosynthesis